MKESIKKLWNLYKTYEEVINYLIFGGLTTFINLGTYALFTYIFNVPYLVSTVIAWIVGVLFAFVTNKLIVFKSKQTDLKNTLIECAKFFMARITTLLIDLALKAFFVEILGINDMIATIINQVVVIVLNYVFSKLLVFKKKNSDQKLTNDENVKISNSSEVENTSSNINANFNEK